MKKITDRIYDNVFIILKYLSLFFAILYHFPPELERFWQKCKEILRNTWLNGEKDIFLALDIYLWYDDSTTRMCLYKKRGNNNEKDISNPFGFCHAVLPVRLR